MLLDDILPAYDFTEVHSIQVKAAPEAAYRAINEITMAEISPIMRGLFWLRTLPERAAGRKGSTLSHQGPLMSSMLKNGFTPLGEQKPVEIIFGMIVPGTIGRVWQKSSGMKPEVRNAEEFWAFNNPDYLKVVANYYIEKASTTGYVIISTESRTKALSAHARNKFAPYWRMIRPFSGLIRRLMLRGIKRRAEAG
jgi:hypothetical protein